MSAPVTNAVRISPQPAYQLRLCMEGSRTGQRVSTNGRAMSVGQGEENQHHGIDYSKRLEERGNIAEHPVIARDADVADFEKHAVRDEISIGIGPLSDRKEHETKDHEQRRSEFDVRP